MTTLYEIPIEAHRIEEELADSYGEITPEIEIQIAEFLAAGKDKVEAAAAVTRSIEADALVCEFEAERLSKRAEGLRTAANRLKRLMLYAVDEGFGGKVKTAKFTIWGQTSAPHYAIELVPGSDVYQLAGTYPEYFRQREPEMNKTALIEKLKKGETLPDGIHYEEIPGSRFLRIK